MPTSASFPVRKYRLPLIGLALSVFAGPVCFGQSASKEEVEKQIGAMQAVIEQWVSLGKDIHKTKANWLVEKEVLEASKVSLSQEVAQIEEAIADAKKDEAGASTDDTKRAEETRLLEEASALLEQRLTGFEDRLVLLSKRLPEFLTKEISAELETLNNKEKRKDAGLATRVTNLVTILTAAEKANGDIHLLKEERALDGKEQSVDSVYFGLSIAYSANQTGDAAWIGYPEQNGWVFVLQPKERIAEIAHLVAMANGEGEIGFVSVPAKITD